MFVRVCFNMSVVGLLFHICWKLMAAMNQHKRLFKYCSSIKEKDAKQRPEVKTYITAKITLDLCVCHKTLILLSFH